MSGEYAAFEGLVDALLQPEPKRRSGGARGHQAISSDVMHAPGSGGRRRKRRRRSGGDAEGGRAKPTGSAAPPGQGPTGQG